MFLCANIKRFIVLHPAHKLHYFEKAGWETAWISNAEKLLRDKFEASYSMLETDNQLPVGEDVEMTDGTRPKDKKDDDEVVIH